MPQDNDISLWLTYFQVKDVLVERDIESIYLSFENFPTLWCISKLILEDINITTTAQLSYSITVCHNVRNDTRPAQ